MILANIELRTIVSILQCILLFLAIVSLWHINSLPPGADKDEEIYVGLSLLLFTLALLLSPFTK